MTAAQAHIGPWTVHDLLALPEDGNRHELIDGALLMSPPPSPAHQDVSFALHKMLDTAARESGAGVRIWEGIGVRIADNHVLVPDLVIATDDMSHASWPLLESVDVRLVVEIVSPGSTVRERTEKPYLYAEAAIPHFWRIETNDYRGRDKPLPVIHSYELVGIAEYGTPRRVGSGERFESDEPVPLAFDPAELTRP